MRPSATGAAQTTTTTTQTTPGGLTATAAQTPTEIGVNAGKAIQALYTQYKADGKFDYTNFNNISNTMLLLAATHDLPANTKNGDYMKQFGQGMMLSAVDLINKDNVTAVTNNLTEIATQYAAEAGEKVAEKATQAQNTMQNASEKLASAAQTASAVASLLSMFK